MLGNTQYGWLATLLIVTRDSRNQNGTRSMRHSTDHFQSGNGTTVSHTLLIWSLVPSFFLPQSHTMLELVSRCSHSWQPVSALLLHVSTPVNKGIFYIHVLEIDINSTQQAHAHIHTHTIVLGEDTLPPIQYSFSQLSSTVCVRSRMSPFLNDSSLWRFVDVWILNISRSPSFHIKTWKWKSGEKWKRPGLVHHVSGCKVDIEGRGWY